MSKVEDFVSSTDDIIDLLARAYWFHGLPRSEAASFIGDVGHRLDKFGLQAPLSQEEHDRLTRLAAGA